MVKRTTERMANFLLLLKLIEEVDIRGYISGAKKLQKLTFLSEWNMFDAEINGFNYNFIKLIWGPYSSELNKDLDLFTKEKLVTGRKDISLTNRAKGILHRRTAIPYSRIDAR